ncbi:MAG: sensor histidine kinase [Parabacteroides sp.]|nr:sensor histidine kinase [Parabacteroides sp.]
MSGIIHVAAWGVVLCTPLFFTGRYTENVTFLNYLRFIIPPFSFIVLFYINYFYLVERFIFRKEFVRFICINLLLIAGLTYSVHLLMDILPAPAQRFERPEHDWQDMARFFIGNTIIYMLVAGLSVAIKMTQSWYEAETAQKELEKSRSEAELQNLKSQLNPHFLFNTLNNIYSLIAISPDKAQRSVHDLSRLLRYVLYESSYPDVTLGKEIEFIRNYIDLMRIRLPEKVRIEVTISPDIKPDTPLAPLLFISLIENAFKHGTSNIHPSFITIEITQNDRQIDCLIRNSYFPKDSAYDKSGSGIGLINLRKRLSLLYPGKADLACWQEGEFFNSQLTIRPEF